MDLEVGDRRTFPDVRAEVSAAGSVPRLLQTAICVEPRQHVGRSVIPFRQT